MKISNELKKFIQDHMNDNLPTLLLQRDRYPDVDLAYVVQQIGGRKKATEKLPEIASIDGFIYPVKESLEQCSSELTALYKSNMVEGKKVADLTGGFGIDSFYMAEKAKSVWYVEKNKQLSDIAFQNFSLAKKNNIKVLNLPAEDFLKMESQKFDCIYLDPSRRTQFKARAFLLSDCEPDILKIKTTLFEHAPFLLIKASPFLDIKQAVLLMGGVERVHILSVKNECKELLFEWTGKEGPLEFICCELSENGPSRVFHFYEEQEKMASIPYSKEVLTFLYEPHVSVLKAGGFKVLGEQYPIKKLHPNSHLYTSENVIESFFGKRFIVEKISSVTKNEIKAVLPEKYANVVVRNFPNSTEEIKKRFQLKDGGDVFLFFTTLLNGDRVCIRAKKLH